MSLVLRILRLGFLSIFLTQYPLLALGEEVRVGGTGSALATLKRLAHVYHQRQQQVDIQILPNLGSKGAMRGIASNKLDVAVISRQLTEAEAKSGLSAYPFARTPLVVVTSKGINNGVISTSKLAEIYRGEQKHWPDGALIRLVLRPLTDGDSQMLMRHSPLLEEALKLASSREGLVTGINDQDAANALERLPDSLGVSTLSLLLEEKRHLNLVALDGQRAVINGVTNPDYPLQKELFLVVRNQVSSAAKDFVDFVTSNEAKKLLAREGYVFSK